MQRTILILVYLVCLAMGCGGGSQPVDPRGVSSQPPTEGTGGPLPQPTTPPTVSTFRPAVPVNPPTPDDDPQPLVQLVNRVVEPSQQERYDNTLLEAVNLLSERKYTQALLALETAQTIQDTEPVRQEIAKVKGLIQQQEEQHSSATRTAQDIQTVLNEGKADEAARLSTDALQQFGGSELAETLTRLKRQADALTTALDQNQTGLAERRTRLLQEGDAALRDGNLRAGLIGLEQALQLGDNPAVRQRYEEARTAVQRYDDQRQLAFQLRRNPYQLEDALAALREAQKAWDTPQVRMDQEEFNLALQKRRDRLTVADFELRGDVGLPLAGRTLSEELLPHFKSRFDLAEREQINQVLGELKLEAAALPDNPEGRQEVGRLARVRYMVVGSVTPLQGVTVHARLVDVSSGLIVQTARLSAPDMNGLMRRLSVLAQMLMMNDEQKAAFEHLLAEKEVVALKPIDPAPLPPPPPPVVPNVPPPPPPPPLVTYTMAPVPLGGVSVADFNRLPPVVVVPAGPPPVEVIIAREDPRRRRMLQLSLEIGDNLFRRGLHQEAHRQFSLALSFCDDHRDIEIRIGRCRPFLPPPPPPIVVVPPPVVVVRPTLPLPPPVVVVPPPFIRPRVIFFSFVVNADPGLVPSRYGDLLADQYASYFGNTLDIIDRGEVCWYMGRLGITMREVLNDPSARYCLAQALNARFILYGTVQQTFSFDVNSHLIDARTGNRTGTGKIHVQDHQELKLRLSELAKQIRLDPNSQAQLAREGQDSEKVLNQARQLQKTDPAQAAAVLRTALKQNPNNTAMQSLLTQNEQILNQKALQETQVKEAARRQAEAEAARKKQVELARQSDLARQRAEQEAKSRTEANRQLAEQKKQKAYEQLRADGQKALLKGDYAEAVQNFQSATALKPSEEGFKELAQAQAKAQEASRQKLLAEQQKKDLERKRAQEAAQARVDAEKKRLAEQEAARRKVQEEHDQKEYARLLDQSKLLLKNNRYPEALAAAQSAQQLRRSPEIEQQILNIKQEQSLAVARLKGDKERLEAEKRVAEEKTRQAQAEAANKTRQDSYSKLLKQAQQDLLDKKYDQAITQYQEAGKLFRTDAVISGLRQAEQLRSHELAVKQAEANQKQDQEKKLVQIQKLLADGQAALTAGNYDAADKSINDAAKLAPGNVDVLAARNRLQQARQDYLARNRKKLDDYQALLQRGRSEVAAGKYNEALASFQAASQLLPEDAAAKNLIAQTRKAQSDAVTEEARKQELEQKGAKVRQLVAGAQQAIGGKDFAGAGRLLDEARKLLPTDPAIASAQADLDKARKVAVVDPPRSKKTQEDYELAFGAGQDAMKKRNYQGAVNAYTEALRLLPGDARATEQLAAARKLLASSTPTPPLPMPPVGDTAFKKSLTAGQTALAAKQYDDAIKHLGEAVHLKQGDAQATALLKQAQTEKANQDAAGKRQQEYTRQLTQAQAAQTGKRYQEAITHYNEALKLVPGDATATRGLADARKELAEVQAGARLDADHAAAVKSGRAALLARKFDEAIKDFTEALRLKSDDKAVQTLLKEAQTGKAGEATQVQAVKKQQYNQQMNQGQAAMTAKRFAEAVNHFSEALKLIPNDPAATQARTDAVKALNAPKPPPLPNPMGGDYASHMTSGGALEKQRKWGEAIQAYQAALKLMPGDARAAAGLKSAQIGSHLAEADKALVTRKTQDAIKAYEEVLKLDPTNMQAKNGIKRLKGG